jgi:hypothetical protein
VRAIAEALHGAASACEAPGGGALLRVAVPLADASPGPVTGATAPPAPPAAAAAARPQRTALSAGGRSPREPATRGPSTT